LFLFSRLNYGKLGKACAYINVGWIGNFDEHGGYRLLFSQRWPGLRISEGTPNIWIPNWKLRLWFLCSVHFFFLS
jgi:hypothetical protein